MATVKRILIRHTDGKREIALMEERRLLFFAKEEEGVQSEQIYLGVVDRIVKGMEAAFVRIGRDQTGFLPWSECFARPRSGEQMLLQIKKPAVGEKAPFLTANIALAGRYAILTPLSPALGVSKKITGEADRAFLLDTALRLSPAGMGLVMRTEALHAPEEDLKDEIRELARQWQEILQARAGAQAPCLIRDRDDRLRRLLRDEHGKIAEILTDSGEDLPTVDIPVRLAENPFDLYNVSSRLEKSLQRKVWLDSGGYLVIDRTEAMTVIDVNSGKYTGGRGGTEQTFLRLNLEATGEIARLMRLRNMGGIILIDFVDMQEEESRLQVRQALENALLDDPVKAVVHDFTSLGLLEVTRKKTEASL